MSKNALDLRRGPSTYWADPAKDIFLPGIDDVSDDCLARNDGKRHQLKEETVRNIMKLGVGQALKVTKRGDKIVPVDGFRRVLHLREANRRLIEMGEPPREVLCIHEKGSDEDLFAMSISLNDHRMDVGVVARARKAQQMAQQGVKPADIRISFGVVEQTLVNWETFLTKLDERVIQLVEDDKLSFDAGLALCDKDDQYERALKAIEGKKNGKRPTRKDLDGRIHPPPKRLVNKLVEEPPDWMSADFLMAIRWARGMVATNEVNAKLAAWIEEQGQKKGAEPLPKRETDGTAPAKRRGRPPKRQTERDV